MYRVSLCEVVDGCICPVSLIAICDHFFDAVRCCSTDYGWGVVQIYEDKV